MKNTFLPSSTTIWRTLICSSFRLTVSRKALASFEEEDVEVVTRGEKKASRVLRLLLASAPSLTASKPPVDLRFLVFVVVVLSTALFAIFNDGTDARPVREG